MPGPRNWGANLPARATRRLRPVPLRPLRLVTAAEMRCLDHATISGGRASGYELMERAGLGVAAAIERRYGSSLGLRVLVLCGPGNNGGDGFVAARGLRARGAEVHAGLIGAPAQLKGDARAHFDAMIAAGVEPMAVGSEEQLRELVARRDPWDFAIDALLGTGASGVPHGLIAAAVQELRSLDDLGTSVIAVDLPTGVNTDTGEIARRTVRADLTVTFGFPKRAHWLYPARAFAGAVEVVDIGLLETFGPDDDPSYRTELATTGGMAELVPRREPRAHKGSVGRVLLIGGAEGLTGAVALAAHAATRAGAGYVVAAVPHSLNDILEAKLTEEMTLAMPETTSRALSTAGLAALVGLAERAHVVVLGNGMSRDPESAQLARLLAARLGRPLVIDADGLNAFAGRSELLADAPQQPVPAVRIVTPHIGEMARLTGLDPDLIELDRIECARTWAQRWHAVVVLKGAPTVTASPTGHVTVNGSGNPGLATAGTGDVLCGVIAALVAQGLQAYDAARLGAFVHGLAADRIAQVRGQLGMSAQDVLLEIPAALHELVVHRGEALERV